MFTDIQGAWPTNERFILISCDETYFNKYFPRFYKTFTHHWQLPIHAHIIDPSEKSLSRLGKLGVSHTWCFTSDYDWKNAVKTFRISAKNDTHSDKEVKQWLYECYCQCQRFVVMGSNMTEKQSVIVADVDAYAQHTPSEQQAQMLFSNSAFTKYRNRLMATFCHFHPKQIKQVRQLSSMIVDQLNKCFVLGMDQKALAELFMDNRINLKLMEWIRHQDVKMLSDIEKHKMPLIYHEKGLRGKNRKVIVNWQNM